MGLAQLVVDRLLEDDLPAAQTVAQAPQQPQQVTWGTLAQTLRSQQAQATAKKVLGGAAKVGLGFLPGIVGQLAGIAAEAAPLLFQNDRSKDPRLAALDMDDAYNVLQREVLAAFVKYVAPTINRYATDPASAQKPIDPNWMNRAMHDWLKSTYNIELRKLGTTRQPTGVRPLPSGQR